MVSRAVAFIFGTTSQLLAVLMGVCVFKEYSSLSLYSLVISGALAVGPTNVTILGFSVHHPF